MADFVIVADDFVIIKIKTLRHWAHHGSILNGRPIHLYINNEDELLNFQEKIGGIAEKNWKDKIIDPKVDQFYGHFLSF